MSQHGSFRIQLHTEKTTGKLLDHGSCNFYTVFFTHSPLIWFVDERQRFRTSHRMRLYREKGITNVYCALLSWSILQRGAKMIRFRSALLLSLLMGAGVNAQQPQPVGMFDGQGDIGAVLHPGAAEFDTATKTYTLGGSGENMWLAKDEFFFVWKKISAEDLTLSATISILSNSGDGHRKAVLMIRKSLDEDAAYVDAARHGEGLTSLQFRERKGGITREIEANVSGPASLRIEKRGNRFYMWIAKENEKPEFAGGSTWVEMRAPFYVGIGVCAHNKDNVVKAAFSDVNLDTNPKRVRGKARYSTVETVLLSGEARTAYVSQKHVSSPGWSANGKSVTFEEERDEREVPFSPVRTAAPVGPPMEAVAARGFTYFTSKSSGRIQIWRKSADGSQSEQFTPDDFSNTSPHVSPDGKYLLFLSYSKEYESLSEDMPLELRLMVLSDSSIKTLATFEGGPNSLGEQPWSPDGKRVVFVSYQSIK